jgi:N6-adenosine-specific RNA methylase IME4
VNVLDGAGRRTRAELHADDEARVARLQPVVGTFITLVVDFPWRSDWLSDEAQKTPGYATMALDELFALPVPKWAADDCHLYFWTPNNFMPLACAAVAHYGFTHRNIITWIKPHWGHGHHFRNQTEQVIFATRGELRTRSDSIPNYFEAPIGEHSEKPEIFYDIVRRASYLPAGEAFQRQTRDEFVNLYAEMAADGEAAE